MADYRLRCVRTCECQTERRETQKKMKEAFKKHKRHEKAMKRKELAALNKVCYRFYNSTEVGKTDV